MHLELNSIRFFFKIMILVIYRQSLIINRDDNCREKIVIFLQYMGYYSFTSIHIYLWNIYVIKNHEFK